MLARILRRLIYDVLYNMYFRERRRRWWRRLERSGSVMVVVGCPVVVVVVVRGVPVSRGRPLFFTLVVMVMAIEWSASPNKSMQCAYWWLCAW